MKHWLSIVVMVIASPFVFGQQQKLDHMSWELVGSEHNLKIQVNITPLDYLDAYPTAGIRTDAQINQLLTSIVSNSVVTPITVTVENDNDTAIGLTNIDSIQISTSDKHSMTLKDPSSAYPSSIPGMTQVTFQMVLLPTDPYSYLAGYISGAEEGFRDAFVTNDKGIAKRFSEGIARNGSTISTMITGEWHIGYAGHGGFVVPLHLVLTPHYVSGN